MHRRVLSAGLKWVLIAGIAGLLGTGRQARAQVPTDALALRALNAEYVEAFLRSDVAFFQSLLTDDFSAILADGRLIDRAEFLREASSKPLVKGFEVHDVATRCYSDAAVVSAWVSYTKPDGSAVRTRYFDLYVRVAGRWRLASVQWTRMGPAPH